MMGISNPPKAILALVGMAMTFALMMMHVITSDTGMPIITMVVGYAVGNGIAAKQGQDVQPIIGARKPKQEVDADA